MANKKKSKVTKKKERMIKTRTRPDNSIEVQIVKNPGHTFLGKLVAWLICIGTIIVPLIALIFMMVNSIKK